jgi:hypothetical protein
MSCSMANVLQPKASPSRHRAMAHALEHGQAALITRLTAYTRLETLHPNYLHYPPIRALYPHSRGQIAAPRARAAECRAVRTN